MKSQARLTSPAHLRCLRPLAGLALSLCLAAPLLAKKGGGGGGPGGGTEDPPADPLPVVYALTWLTDPSDGSGDQSSIFDIDANGVAVGSIRPGGSAGLRYGVVSFPGRAPLDVEAVARNAGAIPQDWRLTGVYRISDDLVIGGDVWAADGTLHAFAAQLTADGTGLAWLKVFPRPAGATRALFEDMSENGSYVAIKLTIPDANGDSTYAAEVWDPQTDSVTSIPLSLEYIIQLSVNNSGLVAYSQHDGGTLRDTFLFDTLTQTSIPIETDSRFGSWASDLGESDEVVGQTNTGRKTPTPARWTAANGWESVAGGAGTGALTAVNNAGQCIGMSRGKDDVSTRDDVLFFYSDADGYHELNDLVVGDQADLDRWFAADNWFYAIYDNISDVELAGGANYPYLSGTIVPSGGEYQGFVLTPVPAPAP